MSVSLFDWKYQKIPNRLLVIILILAIPHLDFTLLFPFLIFYLSLYLCADMGAGDLKYGLLLSLIYSPLDFSSYLITLFLGLLLTAVIKKRGKSLPLAPAITVATLING